MSGSQQLLLGGIPTAVPVDPYFYSVTSLLHGDGTNGGQNNTFLDSSTNNFTITRNGNTTQGSFSPFSQTGWGNYFNGPNTGSYLRTPASTDFQLGTSDFTIEFWAYTTDITSDTTVCQTDSGGSGFFGMLLNYSNGTNITWYATSNGSSWNVINGGVLCSAASIKNTWTHFAYVRNGSTFTAYVNGIAVYTTTSSASIYQSANQFVFGSSFAGSHPSNFGGYLSNFRYVKGTAVYTSNFTPSTTPLTAITNTKLLSCQANRFLDASASAHTLTVGGSPSVQPFSPFNPTTAYSTSAVGGSGYFDGSGDYLQVASGTNALTLTTNFTIEWWLYRTSNGDYAYIAQGGGAGDFNLTNGIAFQLYQTATTFYFDWNNGGSFTSISTAVANVPLNQWNHIALGNNGTTTRIWVNGTSVTSTTSAATWGTPTTRNVLYVGRLTHTAGYQANGFISGMRVVTSDVYGAGNTTITVPTAPLTAITNTQLLTNYTNGAIFDNAAVADYETVGNAQISTSVKKYGTGSLAFDGTGDYLLPASNQNFAFRTGDFTVEYWIYTNSSADDGIFQLSTTAGGFATSYTNGMMMAVVSGVLYYALGGSSVSTGLTINNSTWYHIAMCRTSGVLKIYVNGTPVISTANTTDVTATNLVIGGYYSSSYTLVGYIDDFRISQVSRYPYGFTPPTAEFPNIGGTVTLTADPYYDYTTLLLPGNGTNGAQNNTFLDSSTNNFTITRNGNTTQGTFSPFSQTGWGNYFDGSSNLVTTASQVIPTGSFTIEAWAFVTSSSATQTILAQGTGVGDAGRTWIGIESSSGAKWAVQIGGTQAISSLTPVLNSWTHVAMTYNGSTITLYVNGTSVASASVTQNASNTTLKVGANWGAYNLTGYVSNARVSNSVIYTSNFTPSTSPFSAAAGTVFLSCQSNRFVDTSSNAYAITTSGSPSVQAFSPFNPTAAWSAATNGGSGYFDGSGDYLTIGGNSNLAFGTGDFTIEFWAYINSFASAFQHLYDGRPATTDGSYPTIRLNSATLEYVVGGAVQITGSAVTGSTWNHFAVCRSGASTKMFLNGIQTGSTYADSNNYLNPASRPAIGGWGYSLSGGYSVSGYMGDVRSIKGTALYTANFTPPTAPLTAITNTQLLCNFTNAGIYDATSKNDLETVGNAQISTTQSKFGGSSMYFDGTGDWLAIPATQNIVFGTADFTIEMWVYSGSQSSTSVRMMGNGAGGSWASGKYILTTTTAANPNKFTFAVNNTTPVDLLVSTTTFNDSTWRHVAITRYGNVFRLFVNGIQESTNTSSASVDNGTAVQIRIGSGGISGDADWAGYIDDLRITKGIARYTSNFTVPTTAFLTL